MAVNRRLQSKLDHYYTGFFILAALTVGGGTRPGLMTDFALQLLAVPLLWFFIRDFPHKTPKRAVVLFLGLVIGFLIWQFLPVSGLLEKPFVATVDAGRTLGSGLIAVVMIALFHRILIMKAADRTALIPWVLTGAGLNFVLSFLQFSSANFAIGFQPLSYQLSGGFFANPNHLSALFVVCVPLIVGLYRQTDYPILSVPTILLLMVFQLVVNSRAGTLMIFAMALATYATFAAKSWKTHLVVALFAIAGGVLVVQNATFWISDFRIQEGLTRGVFAHNTLIAIQDHLPWGSGLGTFTLIYPNYGLATGIFSEYVNNAHNDYLELVLEGGIVTAALIVFYFVLVAKNVFRRGTSDFQKAAALGVLFLSLHSAADYPLRTMGIAAVFAFLNAIIFAGGKSYQGNRK